MLAHLSVGLSNELLLIGGLSGSERTDKVNELLRIEEGGEIVYGLQDWIQQWAHISLPNKHFTYDMALARYNYDDSKARTISY